MTDPLKKDILSFSILLFICLMPLGINSQILENISIELNGNSYLSTNKSSLNSFEIGHQHGITAYDYVNEYNQFNFGYNASLNFKLNTYLSLKLLYGQLNYRRKIDLKIEDSGVFTQPPQNWEGFQDEIKNRTLGIIIEYNYRTENNEFPVELGVIQQNFNTISTEFIGHGMEPENLALKYSIGYRNQITHKVWYQLKLFSVNTITGKRWRIPTVRGNDPGRFFPNSFGIELGIRYSLQ